VLDCTAAAGDEEERCSPAESVNGFGELGMNMRTRSRSATSATIGRDLRAAVLSAHILLVFLALPARAEDERDEVLDPVAAAAGEVLAVSDLCRWDLAGEVEKAIEDGTKQIMLSSWQQQRLVAKIAEARQGTFGRLPEEGREKMKTDICKPAERDYLEKLIAGLSFAGLH
jgi:hypothetical protein